MKNKTKKPLNSSLNLSKYKDYHGKKIIHQGYMLEWKNSCQKLKGIWEQFRPPLSIWGPSKFIWNPMIFIRVNSRMFFPKYPQVLHLHQLFEDSGVWSHLRSVSWRHIFSHRSQMHSNISSKRTYQNCISLNTCQITPIWRIWTI